HTGSVVGCVRCVKRHNKGFMYGIAPILDNIYKNPEDEAMKKVAYERHMMYYNCTPQTCPFVLGLTASLEELYYEDQE
ncbi:PTS system mannose/fructose/sorbose family transporter subunit IID, partial [Enterococcus faecium]|uniref:PTS system mannose/fructose/sorbose family transporter subunit IID n=1 Tax=Enterococcus faecium TaxID=1352 RepID=UPI003CC63258